MRKFTFLIISLFFFNTLSAQNMEFGLNLGMAIYTGDIEVNAKNYQRQKRSNAGAFLRIPLNSNFNIRAQVFHGQFYANEKQYGTSDYRTSRGLSFNTIYTELSARLEYQYLKMDGQFYLEDEDPTITLYSFAGFGATMFNTQTSYNSSSVVFDKSALEADARHSTTAPVLTAGLGSKYQITNSIAVGLEGSFQKPLTDYLDGISKISNSKTKDYYFFGNLTVAYTIGSNESGNGYRGGSSRKKVGCPTF
jgi:opacity protein-like surface antigen